MIHQETLPAGGTGLKRPWAFWMLFFFQFAAIGIYFTYLNIYYREAGLSGTQIGTINMATALIGVVSAIGWGYLADRTGQSRLIIAAGAVGALVVAQFVPFIHTYWAFMGLGVLASLSNSAPMTLVDSTILSLLGEQRDDYGRYRLGGTIGYILMTLTAGFLFDWAGLRMMFPIYGLIMILFAGTALFLPATQVRIAGRQFTGLNEIIRRPAWILFTVCVFLVWIGTNASLSFLGVTLQAMGANQSLIGIAITVGAIVEIPFMIFSGAFLKQFGSIKLMLVAMSLMVIRFFLLGWMPAPSWAIAINALNGPAFVLFWNSAVTYVNRTAPAGLAGTAQGLLASTMSLAGVFSAILTGWLFDLLGGNQIFTVMAFVCLAALLIFTAGNLKVITNRVS